MSSTACSRALGGTAQQQQLLTHTCLHLVAQEKDVQAAAVHERYNQALAQHMSNAPGPFELCELLVQHAGDAPSAAADALCEQLGRGAPCGDVAGLMQVLAGALASGAAGSGGSSVADAALLVTPLMAALEAGLAREWDG